VAHWLANGGSAQDKAVDRDLNSLRQAIGQSTSATAPAIVSTAGQLSSDAKAAAVHRPPRCTGSTRDTYLIGMAAFALGGLDVEYGRDTQGTGLLTRGIHKSTQAINSLNRVASVN